MTATPTPTAAANLLASNQPGPGPEWSPNEGCLRKFERLGYALVRTKPTPEVLETRKRRHLWPQKWGGLAGPFVICLLISIPYVSENTSGLIIIASLLLAGLDAALAVWCYNDFESQHGHCSSDLYRCIFSVTGEFPAFLIGWWKIQGTCAALAVTARTLSLIIDSLTGRHVENFTLENFGVFTPFGAPMDPLAFGVVAVPTILVSLGMEESGLFRLLLYFLTMGSTLVIFGSALMQDRLFPITEEIPPELMEFGIRELYGKILSGAVLLSVGFYGLYKTCSPENLTLKQHQNFEVNKRWSLRGFLATSIAFIFYLLEATVLTKVQPESGVWIGDQPLLWPLEHGFKITVAALGMGALALGTFEFLIPLCTSVTKMANDGLLYHNFRKDKHEVDESQWNPVTPLLFGLISGLEATFLDSKGLLGLIGSSLMSTHIVVAAAMLSSRYQVRVQRRYSNSTGVTNASTPQPNQQPRRLMTVNFQKSRTSVNTLPEGSPAAVGLLSPRPSAAARPPNRRSSDLSVSGYESDDFESCYSDNFIEAQLQPSAVVTAPVALGDETDVDAAVTEYNTALSESGILLNPTLASGRRVGFSTIALIPCCIALAFTINRSNAKSSDITNFLLTVSSGTLIFLLLIVISRQPLRKRKLNVQRRSASGWVGGVRNFFQYSIIPWIPVTVIFLHSSFLLEALDLCTLGFFIWLGTGLIIYFSYSVTKSVAAPVPIQQLNMNGPISNERFRSYSGNGSGSGGGGSGTANEPEPPSYEHIERLIF